MQRHAVNPTEWGLKWSLNQAEIVTGASRHLHCSGQVALEEDSTAEMGLRVVGEDDIREQMSCALAHIDSILDRAGMSRENLTSLRFFTTDVDGFLENYDVYSVWIGEAGIMPPQTLLGVNRLVLPQLMIEIEATAAD